VERSFFINYTDRREAGDAKWFNKHKKTEAPKHGLTETPIPLTLQVSGLRPPPSHRPSRRLDSIITNREARAIGTDVHRLLAAIEWFDGLPPETPEDSPAAETVRRFLATPEGRLIFTRPAGEFILWRERTYDVEIEGETHTGTFDRVLITLNNGHPVEAQIYDFKTDQTGTDLQKKYHDQLESYRTAAAKLLGLRLDQVTAHLVPVQ
jgi:ATP-dependent exoDNAse (exonuclease V) beta subunit